MTEYDLQNEIVALIKAEGGYAVRTNPPGVEYGTPDILAAIFGQALVIEVKLPGNTPSKIQLHRLKQWGAAGATCLVAYCLADVVRVIEGLRPAQRGGK